MAGYRLAEIALKSILRIFVPGSWPADLKARWVLVASDGSLIEHGESEPVHWPAADEVEAIVSSEQMVWHRLRVPESLPQSEFGRVLANALEERLIADAESQHITVTSRHKDEAHVMVLARRRLHDIVSRFASVGRPLTGVYSELQIAPFVEDGWHLAVRGTLGILRRNSEDGVCLDIEEGGMPPQLLIALATSRVDDGIPMIALTLHGEEGSTMPNLVEWEDATGLSVKSGAPYRWYVMEGRATNLLHGEFLPAHRRLALLSSIRPALWLAGILLAVDLILNAAQVGWERYKLSEARERIESMFKSTLPNTPVVEPVMQIKKELDRLRSPLGLLRSDDALTLLGVFAEYLDSGVRDRIEQVRYAEASLEITLNKLDPTDLGTLIRQLEIRGLTLAKKTEGAGKTVLLIRLKPL
jgi:general secretion pathway protein L